MMGKRFRLDGNSIYSRELGRNTFKYSSADGYYSYKLHVDMEQEDEARPG